MEKLEKKRADRAKKADEVFNMDEWEPDTSERGPSSNFGRGNR